MQVGAIVVYEQVRSEAQMLATSSDAADSALAPLRLDEQIFLAQLVFRAVRLNDAFHAAAASLLLAHGAPSVAYELPSQPDFAHQHLPSAGSFKLERQSSSNSSYLPSLVPRACTAPGGRTHSASDSRVADGMHSLSAKLVVPVRRMSCRFCRQAITLLRESNRSPVRHWRSPFSTP
jgi:hypothetical protein